MTLYTCLGPDDPELQRAWQTFADPVMPDAARAEVLQYMGTVETVGDGIVHQFRHRCHPQTQQRVLYKVPAAADWHMPACPHEPPTTST